jgi:NCAIR mutase (PurE)-related protein
LNPAQLFDLLGAVREERLSLEEAVRQLSAWPVRDLGHTRLDRHRAVRCGQPEVVYGEGKTAEQLVDISRALLADHEQLLVTRTSDASARAVCDAVPGVTHHPESRCLTAGLPAEDSGEGLVLVVCAGTSDRPVAEEAVLTARMMGARTEFVSDVGVAGLHRLLATTERLREARALVVVAGMEGALPSVVGGLVERPVIAVPTSVGYGANFQGLAALLGMLNSCASGVSVVNIDNGFGAGYQAALINRTALSPSAASGDTQRVTHE